MNAKDLKKIQNALIEHHLDGWLFYDFRHSNPIACRILDIPANQLLTRRFFYWIPASGNPVKIVNKIESHVLDHLPGELKLYSSWQEFESHLSTVLYRQHKIAMEYSPRNAIPEISRVDAGTMDLVREHRVEVVSSGDLVQSITGVWNEANFQSHFKAADILSNIVESTWQKISDSLEGRSPALTEYEVQQFMLNEIQKNHCVTSDAPICAINENSANPHFSPSSKNSKTIKGGDFILLDLWCKLEQPHAMYADITRVGVAGSNPSKRQQEIFQIVKKARDTATEFVIRRFSQNEPIMGHEVDAVCRGVIFEAGYGEYFIHRTGHNIDENDHGQGAHIDSLETRETRQLIPGTCFSIEPGIYLPGEFGVRLEYDLCIMSDRTVRITGGVQNQIETLVWL